MRYIIGIDLGTTTSSVAYVDTEASLLQIQQFKIPQLVAPGYMEALTTLPSFCYLCEEGEWSKGNLALPWKDQQKFFVGKLAQVHGCKVPLRLVQSAKSWLCHAAAQRRERILPFEATGSSSRITPVEATAYYLSHLKEAWNYCIAKGDHTQEFQEQEIVLTVPASFDEMARRLTAEAALQAGLQRLTLLEEPQAAFYSWLNQHEMSWQTRLPEGSTILVCDVGGGTTDFSLIEVLGSSGNRTLRRMTVGNHLLLGGDNIDAAIAHHLESKLSSKELTRIEWMQLKAGACYAKEALLLDKQDQETFSITLQGRGSSVVRNTQAIPITRQELLDITLTGFFSLYSWGEALQMRKTTGMRSIGLPYENEPSITKHLAQFLHQAQRSPDFVLFNGGTMKPLVFQEAIIKSLAQWFPEKQVERLASCNLDLAVSRGAAYYGKVRRGLGTKVSGGAARGYYLRLDSSDVKGNRIHQALTLLPRGCDEEASYESQHLFYLRPNTPVSFQLYTSHVRLGDQSGDLIPIDPEQLQPLPPIHTILRYGKKKQSVEEEKIPVYLAAHLNAIGILEVALKSQKTEHVWSLEFQLRSSMGQDNALSPLGKERIDEQFDQKYLDEAKVLISEAFLTNGVKISKLMEQLEELLEMPRRQWSPSILRGLFEPLLKVADQRKLSAEHEMRWWNLTGFLLRPGCGFPLDDFRIKELWKIILSDSKANLNNECSLQKWIVFRRIAAGLSKGQQLQVAHELLPLVLNKKSGKIDNIGKSDFHAYAEKIRALASLELIDISIKVKLGNAIAERIQTGKAISVDFWALARLGARHLFHGSIANIVFREDCSRWLEILLLQPPNSSTLFAITQLARKIDCRDLDTPSVLFEKILKKYPDLKDSLLQKNFTPNEQETFFGEQLPPGLLFHL